jgi:hypothetical protein
MAIQVGIQEGVKFTSFSKDENNNAVLAVQQGEEMDTLEALTSGGDLGGAESGRILVWALKGDSYGEKIEGKKVVEHINAYKAFFNEIAIQYLPQSEVKFTKMFDGLEVASAVDIEGLSASEIVTVGNNIVSQFISIMENADLTKEMRVKFYRSSAAKNFITLKPEMFMKFGKEQATGFRRSWTVPFIESMDIPAKASKLAYNDYEKGFRNGEQTGLDLSSSKPAAVDNNTSAPASNDDPFAA